MLMDGSFKLKFEYANFWNYSIQKSILKSQRRSIKQIRTELEQSLLGGISLPSLNYFKTFYFFNTTPTIQSNPPAKHTPTQLKHVYVFERQSLNRFTLFLSPSVCIEMKNIKG